MNDQTNRILFEELKNDEISYVYLGKFDNVVLGMATQLIKTSQNEETEGKKNKLSFVIIWIHRRTTNNGLVFDIILIEEGFIKSLLLE